MQETPVGCVDSASQLQQLEIKWGGTSAILLDFEVRDCDCDLESTHFALRKKARICRYRMLLRLAVVICIGKVDF